MLSKSPRHNSRTHPSRLSACTPLTTPVNRSLAFWEPSGVLGTFQYLGNLPVFREPSSILGIFQHSATCICLRNGHILRIIKHEREPSGILLEPSGILVKPSGILAEPSIILWEPSLDSNLLGKCSKFQGCMAVKEHFKACANELATQALLQICRDVESSYQEMPTPYLWKGL